MKLDTNRLKVSVRDLVATVGDMINRGRDIMSNSNKKIPDQLSRLFLAFAVFIIAIWVIRTFVIPTELKETGLHRTSVIKRELAKEFRYAGANACAECHDEEYTKKTDGNHDGLSCELCHGPAIEHVDDPSEVTPTAPRERHFCPVCHNYNLSRPTGFAQINPVVHNPLQPCIVCHDPHDPKPLGVPKECSACHAQIVRTKAVSPHVLLECITCHVTTDDHKLNPREVKPTKPVSREFCAKCHDNKSDVRGTPKIDFETHNENYVCWQCHYPHMPEIR